MQGETEANKIAQAKAVVQAGARGEGERRRRKAKAKAKAKSDMQAGAKAKTKTRRGRRRSRRKMTTKIHDMTNDANESKRVHEDNGQGDGDDDATLSCRVFVAGGPPSWRMVAAAQDVKDILLGLLAPSLDKRWTAKSALRAVLNMAAGRGIEVPPERSAPAYASRVPGDWE